MYHFLPLYFMYNLQHFSPKNGLKPTKVVQISFTVYILVTWVKLSKCKITVAIKLTPYEKFKSLVYLAFNLHVCLCMHSCVHHTSAFHHVISSRRSVSMVLSKAKPRYVLQILEYTPLPSPN